MLSTTKNNNQNLKSTIENLESRLLDSQLEGNLEEEMKLCYILGIKYESLGEFKKSMDYFQSAIEISKITEFPDIYGKSHARILCMYLNDFNVCSSVILNIFMELYTNPENLSIENAFIFLLFFLHDGHLMHLVLFSFFRTVEEFVKRYRTKNCTKMACDILLKYIVSGQIDVETIQNLSRVREFFCCSSCDFLSHIRIMFCFGDICLFQGLYDLSVGFFELAVSLCEHPDGTEFIYLICLTKLVPAYLLRSNVPLAYTTYYLAKDVSLQNNASLEKKVARLLEKIETFSITDPASLIGLRAYKNVIDICMGKLVTSLQDLDQETLSLIIRSLGYCRYTCIYDELRELVASKGKLPIQDLFRMSIIEFHSRSPQFLTCIVNGANLDELIESSDQLSALSIKGILYMLRNDSVGVNSSVVEFRSVLKAICVSLMHSHEFSYFSFRGVSKSISRLVDGFKMENRGQKQNGNLCLVGADKRVSARSSASEYATKGSRASLVTLSINVNRKEFEFKYTRDHIECTTFGSLKVKLAGKIFDTYLISGKISQFIDSIGNEFKDGWFINKALSFQPGKSRINLKCAFSPSSIDFNRIINDEFSSLRAAGDWITDRFRISDSSLSVSFLEIEADHFVEFVMNLLVQWSPNMANVRLVSAKFRVEKLLASASTISFRGNTALNIPPCLDSVNVDLSFNSFNSTLSRISASFCEKIESLNLSDTELILDEFSKRFNCLRELDLSFNSCANLDKLLCSIGERLLMLETLMLDGITTCTEIYPIQRIRLENLKHISLRFISDPHVISEILSSLIDDCFGGIIDLRYSRVNYRVGEQLPRAVLMIDR